VDDRTMHELYFYPFLRAIEVRRARFLRMFHVKRQNPGWRHLHHVRVQPAQRDLLVPQHGPARSYGARALCRLPGCVLRLSDIL
jgi:hypothetical protein